jgi:cyclohexa-1,5-dienecarbonyl-CoA hydratase
MTRARATATPREGTVRVRREGAVARISLERPPLNVLDMPLNDALTVAVTGLAEDPDVVAIVIDGGEARGFSAGVEVADHMPGRVSEMLERFHGAVRALWRADCVTIAAIHGMALGGGFELALACDFIVVEENARLAFPEIALGCYPPVAAAVLPARIGWPMAAELVLSGEPLPPARALQLGLVNRVCAAGAIAAETDRLLRPMLAHSPAVLREAKAALREGATHAAAPALEAIERRYLGSLMRLEDAGEGIAAFLEKRSPRFRNR